MFFSLGTLPLTSLGSVWLVHAGLIGSVGAMCPFLKDVTFRGRQSGEWCYDYHFWSHRSPESLETALKNWPQVYYLKQLIILKTY